LEPKNPEAYYNRALLNEKLGEVSKAFDDYSKVIELDPKHEDAYANRGMIFMLHHEACEDAIEDFQKAIELDDTNIEAYCNMAQAYQRLNNLKKAEEYLSQAIENVEVEDAPLYDIEVLM
jgi:tetratricopeptide (TPR) repeat protein